MRKISRRSFLKAATVACALTALTACGGGDESAAASVAKDENGAYVDTLTITLGRFAEPSAAALFPEGQTFEDNAYTRYIESKLNVDLVDSFEAGGDAYTNQLATCVASGELPDILTVNSYDTFVEMVNNGLTYDLTDGSGRTYLAGKHLLSVRDLNLSAHVGELLDAGVRSLKIEGRLKDINYIRNTVAYYRRAVDDALTVRPHLRRASAGESVADFTPDTAKSFTRGESEYFFAGKRAGVASFDTPKAVGEYAGCVTRVERTRFRLDRAHTLAAGDGICFLTPRGLVGTNVNAADGDCVTPNRMEGIAPGCEVYRNYDHRFNQLLERSRTRRVIPAAAVVTVSAEGVMFRYTDCEGVAAVAERRVALEPANNAEANAAAVRTQAMKSGDTIFAVRSAEVQGAEWFVPASLASQLRREGLAALLQARLARGVEHRILSEGAAEYPSETLSAEENVTNRLAEAFYRDHGVRQIERGLDLAATTAGHRVMRSAYCIRREIGECLKERPRLKGDLWLERGANRYRLEFDCVRCEMSLVDCTRKETAKSKP